MVFTSVSFIFLFLPIALSLYYLASLKGRLGLQNYVLLFISIIFYAWSGVGACLLLIFSSIVNYYLGCHKGKKAFITAIIFNLSILIFFKYFNFLLDNLETIIQLLIPEFNIPAPIIPLPVGISFFTFQILSYQIDVYKGNVKPQKSLSNLMLYIVLFPQLIAGPIVRYKDVETEIKHRNVSAALFQDGIRRFIIGFSKKVLLADRMGYLCEQIFSVSGSLATPYAWLGAICFSLQLYLDFSAYSDMAIGLGHLFGFHFLENFDYPFISKSIKEFWNRWHISLSSWFRDYVYIPLGGSRNGKIHTYKNLLIIFLLTGIWHGANWTFVVWGMIHGVFICLERIGLEKILKRMPPIVGHLYVLIIFSTSLVFFRSNSMSEALLILKSLFIWNLNGIKDVSVISLLDKENIFFIFSSMIASIPLKQIFLKNRSNTIENAGNILLCFIFILSVCYRMSSGFNPFIYFRF